MYVDLKIATLGEDELVGLLSFTKLDNEKFLHFYTTSEIKKHASHTAGGVMI
jgi:hypothetical protein